MKQMNELNWFGWIELAMQSACNADFITEISISSIFFITIIKCNSVDN